MVLAAGMSSFVGCASLDSARKHTRSFPCMVVACREGGEAQLDRGEAPAVLIEARIGLVLDLMADYL
jgi:hypothetical protein